MFPSQEEEVTLEKIEFDWIEKCTSLKSLRRAQKILKDDGNLISQFSITHHSHRRLLCRA